MESEGKVNSHKRHYPRRVQACVSREELETIEKAAAIKGLSLSSFAAKAAVKSAMRVVLNAEKKK